MGQPLYLTAYTPGPYADEAAAMIASAAAVGVEVLALRYEARGDWCRNCAAKPTIIRAAMAQHPGRPVVWLDADARLVSRPELFDGLTADFAAHWFADNELISACLYFAPSPEAVNLLDDWCAVCEADPEEWDQRHLQRLVSDGRKLRVLRLPPEYCWIEAEPGVPDISERRYGQRTPVIRQTQASRRWKSDLVHQ